MSIRVRVASLWLSQVARVFGDGCLRLVAMLALAAQSDKDQLSAWHVALTVFVLPFILLSPLNGCLSNALPRRWVLTASAALCTVAIAVCAWVDGSWMWCLAVVATGAAVNSAARYAMLPAAARDGGMELPRLSGFVELGAAVAAVASVAVGLLLQPGWMTVGVLAGVNLLGCLAALPTWFPTDTRRPESPAAAWRGFFRDAGRIGRDRAARWALLALASFQALVTAGAGAIVANALAQPEFGDDILESLLLAGVGAAVGSLAAALVGHPRRCLGLVPLGAIGLFGGILWALVLVDPGEAVPAIPCVLLGFTGGMINAPLRAAFLAAIPEDARGNGTAVMNTTVYTATAVLCGMIIALVEVGILASARGQLALLSAFALLGVIGCLVVLVRPMLELFSVWLLWPFYRISAQGPGADEVPLSGPLLIIANHTAYFDPFWLNKVLPRRFTPLVSSLYYDKPGFHFLMRHVEKAIRVPAAAFRREAPEIAEAAEVLRQGGCVLLFPEGMLRRREEPILRAFGRGVWLLLREVPETPVLACWIEGGWGSYASYKGGPPFANKRLDWRRPIDIAIAQAQTVPAAVLADHRATRQWLMRACLENRGILGLSVEHVGEAAENTDAEADETA